MIILRLRLPTKCQDGGNEKPEQANPLRELNFHDITHFYFPTM